MDDKELHYRHRQRVKKRYIKEGLDGFAEHEVLEFLLFYALNRCDTNEIAHKLLNRFGSLSAVLDADISELKKVEGIGDHSAILMNFLPKLMRRYNLDKINSRERFKSMDAVGEYLVNHFIGSVREETDILLFDSAMKLCSHITLAKGSFETSVTDAGVIADLVFSNHASAFVLAHNHPSGNTEPSDNDLLITRELYNIFKPLNIQMLEHMIVSGGIYNRILTKALSVEEYYEI